MGTQQALVAVAQSMLVMVSHLLSRRTRYADLEESVCKPRSVQGHSQRLIRQLEALGCKVTVEGQAEAA
jgi:hypothetical protein